MSTQWLERDHDALDATVSAIDNELSHANGAASPVQQRSDSLTKRRSWLRAAIGTGLIVGSFFAGWVVSNRASENHQRVSMGDAPEDHKKKNEGAIVTTAPVTVRSVSRTVEAVGTLYGYEELTLSAKVEGRVAKIYHDLASIVKPGELLLEMDSTDATLAVEQSERAVQAELAKWGFSQVPSEDEDLTQLPTVVSARLRFELAKSRLERMLPLRNTNSVSADDFEQARSEAQVTESEYRNQLLMAKSAAATARLRSAELAIAKQKRKDCEIRVPTPTIGDVNESTTYSISERLVSEGSLLRPGTEVFRMVLGRKLKLRLSVPEVHSLKIAINQEVDIRASSQPQTVQGHVTKISPTIDRSTRTFIVEVEVPNDDGKLKPGSFAKASIHVGNSERSITVPLAAIYSLAGINKIFINDNGIAREHKVTLGEQNNEWVEILSPEIPSNAIVVTSGQRMLSDGLEVSDRTAEANQTASQSGGTKQ